MRRIFLIALLLCLADRTYAQTVTDNFNRADAADLGANWTQQFTHNIKISSNAAVADTASTDVMAFWNANSFNNDQSSSVAITSSVVDYFGVSVRMVGTGGGSGVNGYVLFVQPDIPEAFIQKVTDGMRSTLVGNFTNPLNAGDVFKLDVTGTTLTSYINGVQLGTTTDSTYSSGSAGIYINNGGSNPTLDNWTGTGAIVSCTPSKVAFTSQPSNAIIGAALGTVTVNVQDAGSVNCNSDTSTITITNKAATCSGMTLGGTASGANVFTTTNLTENAAGACTLHATDGSLTAADSNAFTISAPAAGNKTLMLLGVGK